MIVTNTDWPLGLPNPPFSCTAGGANIDADWLAANRPGVYCFTDRIKLLASFTGYAFVSRDSNSPQAIGATDSLTFTGIGGSAGLFLDATLRINVLSGRNQV